MNHSHFKLEVEVEPYMDVFNNRSDNALKALPKPPESVAVGNNSCLSSEAWLQVTDNSKPKALHRI